MKKLFIYLSFAAALLGGGCTYYDDFELRTRLDNLEDKGYELESRIEDLEWLCKRLNEDIESLQIILGALNNRMFIDGIADGNGYHIIWFSDGSTITIYDGVDGVDGTNGKNGKDGTDGVIPRISVEWDIYDYCYYWVVNGSYLLDSYGNKIRANGYNGANGYDGAKGDKGADGKDGKDGKDGVDGQNGKDGEDGRDGKDGVTPKFKIADGYWYISYDNEKSWTKLGKATGEDGADGKDGVDGKDGRDGVDGDDGKDGVDGDSMFREVTYDDDYVYFTLSDGTRLEVPRSAPLSIEFDKRVVNGTVKICLMTTVEIGYTIVGSTGTPDIEVMYSGDVKAKVVPTNSVEGKIVVTADEELDEEYSRVVVLVSDGDKTIMQSLSFEIRQQFPDPLFRAYVLKYFDTDFDGYISTDEALAVTSMGIGGEYESISSLEGVEFFTNLQSLKISFCNISELDMSQNTALTYLDCNSNSLLSSLDVSKNTALEYLSCEHAPLSTLDVSKNTALTHLNCRNNPSLRALDVSKNTALTYLDCSLISLGSWPNYGSLDISKNTALEYLDCGHCYIGSLDVSKNTALTHLDCGSNVIGSLDVSKNTALEYLDCGFNLLSTLDVSKNTALEYLECGHNSLSTLDVSKNTALTHLELWDASLSTLDVSKNTALTYLDCRRNSLSSLDVSKLKALTYLDCCENLLTSLDLSATKVSSLEADSNPIEYINVGNYYKDKLEPKDWNTTDWHIVGGAITEICVKSKNLQSLDIRECPALEKLECNDNNLAELDVSQNTALKYLYCNDNNLTELDISKNAVLTYLDCSNNQLTALNVYNNRQLQDLHCNQNLLTSLNILYNYDLRCLQCNHNQLTTLTLRTSLEELDLSYNYLTTLDMSMINYTPSTRIHWGISILNCYMESLKTIYVKLGYSVVVHPNTKIIYR